MAKVALVMAGPISPPESTRTAREDLWRFPAVQALRRGLAVDSGDAWYAEQLERITPYPYIWLAPARELTHLRALAARNAMLPVDLAMTRIRLELETGSLDSAALAFRRLDSISIPLPQWTHLAAEITFARGDSAAARSTYYAGAAAICDSSDRQIYTQELSWIATPEELAMWDSLPMTPGAHRDWLEAFWARRDLADGQLPGTRLPEQFRRWREALRDYRWDSDGDVALGTPDHGFAEEDGVWKSDDLRVLGPSNAVNRWRARTRILDDRGAIVMRHGDPMQLPLPPGKASITEQNLSWQTPRGSLIIGFSRINVASGRFGMVARNIPMGDPMVACAFDARLCQLARFAHSPLDPAVATSHGILGQVLRYYGMERARAEHTDANTTTFRDSLGAITQAFGIPNGGVLVVFAVPAGRLTKNPDVPAFAANLRVIIGDSAAGRIVAALDSVRHWHTDAPVSADAWLSAYLTVPAPVGTWDVAITISDTAKTRGSGVRLDAIPVVMFDGKALQLSDPILGRSDAGLVWHHDGVAIPLNPTNAWRTAEPVELTVEADGLVPGRSYSTRFELWKVAGHPKAPSVTVAFTAKTDSAHEVIQRELSVRELDPGDYRLVIRLQDAVTKQAVTRERRVAVRR